MQYKQIDSMKTLFSSTKKELLFLALLATIILITRYILFTNIDVLYYVDSYGYVNNAVLLSEGQMDQSLRGYPFTFMLGVIIKLLGGFIGPINSSIILMGICNIALIFVMYFLSRQFLKTVPALFVALFASLQTNLILYSLVPYFEIFAYFCGFASLYILVSRFSELNLKTILLSLFLFALSILTRFEMLIIFFTPLIILLVLNGLFYNNNRKLIILFIISLTLSMFLFYPQLQSYYSGVSRFDPIQRLLLAMRWDILTSTFNSIFNITSNELLNTSFKLILSFGFLYIFFTKFIPILAHRKENHESKFGFFEKLNYFNSKSRLTVLSLSISFGILLVVATTYYSVSYTILDGELIVAPRQIDSRFLTGPHLYLSWLFVYSLSKLAEQIFRVISLVHKRTKICIYGFEKLVSSVSLPNLLYIVLLIILISPFVHNTWTEGVVLSKNASQTMGLYEKTSQWLATNLKENETAIVPLEVVFHMSNADLRNKTVPYKFFWDKVGVGLRADNTINEYYLIQDQLVHFIEANSSVKYIVVDWMDAYCHPILYSSLGIQNELVPYLKKVHEESIIKPNQWVPRIRVYEIVSYTTLFCVDFGVPLKQFSVLPSDVFVEFGLEGVTIDKVDSRVGFYLPLEEGGSNASRQNYLELQFKPDMEDLQLQLTFYYDANRDGKWSGYDIDYVKSASFNLTLLGWTAGEWHTIYQPIPQAEDLVVQIGIIMTGDKNGTVTLKNLEAYTETPFEN